MTGRAVELDVRQWRADHAADVCECGHPRRDHYREDGAQSLCFHPGCLTVHPRYRRGVYAPILVSHPFALAGGEASP